MQLKPIKCTGLSRAKGIAFSHTYIAACTGPRVMIYDRQFNLLKEFTNLSYVYHVYFSPDETMLALISTANLFYLVSLDDFSITKHRIGGKYCDNLEGRGCWTFDSKGLLVLPMNRETMNSILRCYSVDQVMTFNDLFPEKYWLVSIKPVPELKKYSLVGMDRIKYSLNRPDRWRLIWFDGESFAEYPILVGAENDTILSSDFDSETGTIILYTLGRTIRCDIHGKILGTVDIPEDRMLTAAFSNVFSNCGLSEQAFREITELSASLGLEDLCVPDAVSQVCTSSNGKWSYVATQSGIFVTDKQTNAVLAKVDLEYGASSVVEISENVIAVTTWSGVKIFEVIV